jgi:hypothetical protein
VQQDGSFKAFQLGFAIPGFEVEGMQDQCSLKVRWKIGYLAYNLRFYEHMTAH